MRQKSFGNTAEEDGLLAYYTLMYTDSAVTIYKVRCVDSKGSIRARHFCKCSYISMKTNSNNDTCTFKVHVNVLILHIIIICFSIFRWSRKMERKLAKERYGYVKQASLGKQGFKNCFFF